jgi:glutamate synthase (NADPH) large chain
VAKGTKNYLKACDKGLLKTMAKMGISTLQSYRGAQIFEAVGLDRDLVDRCFTGTASRVSGVGYDVLARECAMRHERAFPGTAGCIRSSIRAGSISGGARRTAHVQPGHVSKLQHAVRRRASRLQGVLEGGRTTMPSASHAARAVPLPLGGGADPARGGGAGRGHREALLHRRDVLRLDLAGGARDPRHRDEPHRRQEQHRRGRRGSGRFTPDPNGDLRRSAIKQVASGRFGVTSWYLVNADEMQIKMAQGAKPGEGGELPGHKVDETIAKTRHSTPGVGLISPPPHHDIYSIEDLAQLIYDLKNANRFARGSA